MDQCTLKYYSDNAAQVAQRYESVVSDLSAHFADSFSKGGKVLDIGCGSGRDLAVLHKLGFDCYGVDPVLKLVEIAQRLHPELENRIALGKLPDLQVPFNGNFDGVGAQYEQNRVVSTRIRHAYMVLVIVFKFDQWFIPRICHAIGKPYNANDCDGEY